MRPPRKKEELRFEGVDPYAAMVDCFAGCVARGELLAPAENGVDQMRAPERVKEAPSSLTRVDNWRESDCRCDS